ncbi:hypothetical protein AB6A40_009606 [Gnathostoma spinigerum]|uniref:Uncharacterized protein n=1 Tax=Gnathostoma spinigerum TaxID=75299 RepID=A0ABD6F146_9BILA
MSRLSDQDWNSRIYLSLDHPVNVPSIVLCNINRINKGRMKEYGMTESHAIFLLKTMALEANMTGNSEEAKDFRDWRLRHNLSTLDIFMKLGDQCEDMILKMRSVSKT